ncbi:MAG: orotidine-5'-phosphate decarboxylase [Candidatus Moranbacteria bacterium]|nr:orotidine-5'-phosphate decarboxylase [Candidatus Moranbacteria bacterium]
MITFSDKLIQNIKTKKTILCVGLDPQLSHIPQFLKEQALKEFKDPFKVTAYSILRFNTKIIDVVAPYCVCVKPQSAFYEKLGHFGIWVLEETIKYAKKKGLMVILDVKRGDGGDTAKAYSRAYFEKEVELVNNQKAKNPLEVDALTLNIQIGKACLDPFIEKMTAQGKGVFAVCKTSFKPNSEIENILSIEFDRVWEKIAFLVRQWSKDTFGQNGYNNFGIVAGATYPEESQILRNILANHWFLVPGFGAQGGFALDAVIAAKDDGLGIIVNSSRGITTAHLDNQGNASSSEEQSFQLIEKAARDSRDVLNQALMQTGKAGDWLR